MTGLGRPAGIAAAIAERLAIEGWDIAFVYCAAYDKRVNGGGADIDAIQHTLVKNGARSVGIDLDLADVTDFGACAALFDRLAALGTVRALVLSHAESTRGGILSTTVDSWDRHSAVNARASWLLIREFGLRFGAQRPEHAKHSEHAGHAEHAKHSEHAGHAGPGRIVALTSDAIHDELAYGVSKGALDRVVFAAAREFASLGITANLVNPGPVDTGWMTDDIREQLRAQTPAGRTGLPSDTAALVSFLLSPDGQWITGQLLRSDGGFSAP